MTERFIKVETVSKKITGFVKGIYLSRLKPLAFNEILHSNKDSILEAYFDKKYMANSMNGYSILFNCFKYYTLPYLKAKTDILRERYYAQDPKTVLKYTAQGLVVRAFNNNLRGDVPYNLLVIDKRVHSEAPDYAIKDIDSSAVYVEFLNSVPFNEALLLSGKLFDIKKSDWTYHSISKSATSRDGKVTVSSKIETWKYPDATTPTLKNRDLNIVRIQRNLWR